MEKYESRERRPVNRQEIAPEVNLDWQDTLGLRKIGVPLTDVLEGFQTGRHLPVGRQPDFLLFADAEVV